MRAVFLGILAGLLVTGSLLGGCEPTARVQLRAEEHYRFAQSYLASESYPLAEQEIRKALALQPDSAEYFGLLALIYQAQGQLAPAEEAYQKATQAAHVSPATLVNYSTLLLLRNREDEAITLAQKALQFPGYNKPALAYTNIGLAYLQKGLFQQAETHLKKALEYQANIPEVHHNLGLVYNRMRRFPEAIVAFQEAIRLRPSYIAAHHGLGQVFLGNGQKEKAREAFQNVIALAPNSPLAVDSQQQLQRIIP